MYTMYNSNNNIANSRCSFTDSKWNDTFVCIYKSSQ